MRTYHSQEWLVSWSRSGAVAFVTMPTAIAAGITFGLVVALAFVAGVAVGVR